MTENKEKNRVSVFIPRGGAHEEPNLFVAVNGVSYLLPKGQTSMVPECVALELELSQKAQEIQSRNMEAMLSGVGG